MLQFVDAFHCTYSNENGKVVIHFAQNEPIEDFETHEIQLQRNEIASIIMDKKCAIELVNAITSMAATADEN